MQKQDNKTKLTKIKCAGCGETETYEDDGLTLDCMPDGYLIGGAWYCSDCGEKLDL